MIRVKTLSVCLIIYLLCQCNIFAQETKSGANPAWQKGNANARIKIEVFNDYQCPACASFYKRLKIVEEKFPNDLQIIFRHSPLTSIHNKAMLAAQATEAAGIQGKFWEMSDLILENQNEWITKKSAVKKFTKYAKQLGLNIELFESDIESQNVIGRINGDIERFRFLKLNSTPSIFLNDKPLNFEDTWDLEKVIKENLDN